MHNSEVHDSHHKMNNKAMDMAMKFLVILIMSAVLLVSIFTFAGNLIRFTDQSQASYKKLVSKLGDATTSDNTFDLILAKKTAVAFFNKGSDSIKVPVYADTGVTVESAGADYTKKSITRPATCPKDKACACYCDTLKEDAGSYLCQKNKCYVFASEFTGNCQWSPKERCDNGILIEREIFNDVKYYSQTGRFFIHYKKQGDKIDIRLDS